MKQHVLQIEIPKGITWYGNEFRTMVGEAHRNTLDPVVFHKDADNRPLNGKPACRFFCSRKMATFVSEREEGQSDVAMVMPHALVAAQRKFGMDNVSIKTFSVNKAAAVSEVPVKYRLIHGVKKTRHASTKAKSSQQYVEQLVIEELERAYEKGHILDLPEKEALGLKVFDVEEKGLRVTGKGGEFAPLLSATFMLDVTLQGFWQVGSLTAKGYGRVVRIWKGAEHA